LDGPRDSALPVYFILLPFILQFFPWVFWRCSMGKTCCVLFLAAALAAGSTLPGQVNFVKNGDFSQVGANNLPLGWKVSFKPFHYPKVADFVWKGIKRMDKAFECRPGGAPGYSKPYPLVVLEQTLVLPAGIPLQVSADIIHSRASTLTNVDRGTVRFYLGGKLVETRPAKRGYIYAPDAMTEQIASRVVLPTGGKVVLKITFERTYYATDVVVHLDNVRIVPAPGPVFAFRGDRKIGKTYSWDIAGKGGAGYLIFLAASRNPSPVGVPIPGVSGNWELSLKRFFLFASGQLDPQTGKDFRKGGPCPNVPALVGVPLYFQPFQFTKASAFSLGFAHRFSFYAK